MPDKGSEQLRQEIAAERERLGTAIDDLKAEVDELKRKLPYAAAAVVGTVVVVSLVRRRFFR